jgi:hypothetical protein
MIHLNQLDLESVNPFSVGEIAAVLAMESLTADRGAVVRAEEFHGSEEPYWDEWQMMISRIAVTFAAFPPSAFRYEVLPGLWRRTLYSMGEDLSSYDPNHPAYVASQQSNTYDLHWAVDYINEQMAKVIREDR